jgi:hypothetical protein
LDLMETSWRAPSNSEFCSGHCLIGGLLHPSSFQCMARLVFLSRYGLDYDYAARKLLDSPRRPPNDYCCKRDCPGRCFIIKAGNKLPADVRFVETSSDSKFDRSILTGRCFRELYEIATAETRPR